LELKHMSQKKKEDQTERENQVFRVQHVEKLRRVEDGCTIIQPFALSEMTNKTPSLSRANQMLVDSFEANLTFAPVTGDTQRRELIRRAAARPIML